MLPECKTYAMLEAAHQRQQQGVDVVMWYIETHKRADTESADQTWKYFLSGRLNTTR